MYLGIGWLIDNQNIFVIVKRTNLKFNHICYIFGWLSETDFIINVSSTTYIDYHERLFKNIWISIADPVSEFPYEF